MEGLGSQAWKIARLPGSLSLSQACPTLAIHHPVWVMGVRGGGAVRDLLQKGRLGSEQRGAGLACLDHLCRADLGSDSLGLQGSWWAELEQADLPAHHGQLSHLLFAGSAFLSTL